MRSVIAMIWLLSLVGCVTSDRQKTVLTQREEEIVVSAVNYHFDEERYKGTLAFLWIMGADPPVRTLARVGNMHAKILPGSKHKRGRLPYRFEILGISFVDPSRAVVDARDFHDGFYSITYRFELSETPSGWIVENAYQMEL